MLYFLNKGNILKKLLLSLVLIVSLVGCSTVKDVYNNSTKEVDEKGYSKSIATKEVDEFDSCSGFLQVTFKVIDIVEAKDE